MQRLDFVTQALEFYDQNREQHDSLFDEIAYFKYIDRDEDLKRNQILMFDRHKKLKYRIPYEVIGVYTNNSHTWTWAWAKTDLKKISIQTSIKVLNYAFDLNPTTVERQMLKSELITSRFRVTNPIQLDIHIAIGAYLSKRQYIFPMVYSGDKQTTDGEHYPRISVEKAGQNYEVYYLILYFDERNDY